jgi:hypothetical protein
MAKKGRPDRAGGLVGPANHRPPPRGGGRGGGTAGYWPLSWFEVACDFRRLLGCRA